MHSIVSEKRLAFVGLPVLLATLALFYVLAAAALFAEAVNVHRSVAHHAHGAVMVRAAALDG